MSKLQIIPRLQDSNAFYADYDLLKSKNPNTRLRKRCENVNQFNQYELDGDILVELLDSTTESVILANREMFSSKKPNPISVVIEAADQEISIVSKNEKKAPKKKAKRNSSHK